MTLGVQRVVAGGGGPLSPCARVSWCHFSHPVSWAGCWVTGLLMGLQGGRRSRAWARAGEPALETPPN